MHARDAKAWRTRSRPRETRDTRAWISQRRRGCDPFTREDPDRGPRDRDEPNEARGVDERTRSRPDQSVVDFVSREEITEVRGDIVTHFLCKTANGKFLKHSVSINFLSLSHSLFYGQAFTFAPRDQSRFREDSEARECSVTRRTDVARSRRDRERGSRS